MGHPVRTINIIPLINNTVLLDLHLYSEHTVHLKRKSYVQYIEFYDL